MACVFVGECVFVYLLFGTLHGFPMIVSRRKYGLNIILSMYVHLCEHKNPVSFDRFERSFKVIWGQSLNSFDAFFHVLPSGQSYFNKLMVYKCLFCSCLFLKVKVIYAVR